MRFRLTPRIFAALLLLFFSCVATARDAGVPAIAVAQLPPEARDVLVLVERGGPYRYDRDGVVFGNYERALPERKRGYYREYTVDTPGLRHRGPRRLVVGCDRGRRAEQPAQPASAFARVAGCAGPADVYYTEDHYRTFRRVLP